MPFRRCDRPCLAGGITLVFAISTLHLLVHALLHLALQDTRARRLVVVGDFEDVRRVDPVVGAPAHDVVAADIVFVHRHVAVRRAVDALVVGRHFGDLRVVMVTVCVGRTRRDWRGGRLRSVSG